MPKKQHITPLRPELAESDPLQELSDLITQITNDMGELVSSITGKPYKKI